MSYLRLFHDVIDSSLCSSCGACVAACPQDVLTISVDDPLPRLQAGADDQCGSCSICTAVCPGQVTGVAESEQRIFGRRRDQSERWGGIVRAVYTARAADSGVLAAASAGGAVTSLLVSALHRGAIDAALVIGRDPERPWVPVPRLAATAAEIIECAQATYCITPNLQMLRDAPYERIAVVGVPCQIEAVQKMRNVGEQAVPAVGKVAFTIELACASSTSRAGTEHLIENRLRLPLADVTRMRYRAGDYPGEFTVWDRDGDQHRLPFHELVTEFKNFKTFRCQACPDWWSGLADISVSDGDPNIFRTSRDGAQVPKASLLVTRTELGDEFVRRAVDAGDLVVRPGTFRPEESLGLQRKRNRYLACRRSYPGPLPTGPTDQEESADRVLGDHEVIEAMSGGAAA